MQPLEHGKTGTATHTASGDPRGFIEFTGLRQLWVHTGTNCNLHCPTCFEQAGPGDGRIQAMTLEDTRPFLDEAAGRGVERFGFTGGEPFVNTDFPAMLDYALGLAPCLVLSNGTGPLRRHMDWLSALVAGEGKHPLTVRISLDFPEEAAHDAGRGQGSFAMAMESLRLLHKAGISCAVARRAGEDEDAAAMSAAYAALFTENGLPADLPVVAFPDLQSKKINPEITENCMRTYHSPESRAAFMCAYSRMLLKQGDRVHLYACTLVDNDPAYDFGADLAAAMRVRTLLRHRRCFSCFASGVSCGG